MGLADGLVCKTHLPACQRQVVQGKSWRLAGGSVRRAFKFFKNIVNVVTATAQMREGHSRRVDRNRVNHWGQPQQ